MCRTSHDGGPDSLGYEPYCATPLAPKLCNFLDKQEIVRDISNQDISAPLQFPPANQRLERVTQDKQALAPGCSTGIISHRVAISQGIRTLALKRPKQFFASQQDRTIVAGRNQYDTETTTQTVYTLLRADSCNTSEGGAIDPDDKFSRKLPG